MNNKISEMRFKVIDPTKEAAKSRLSASLCEAIERVLLCYEVVGIAHVTDIEKLRQAYIDEVKE